METTVYNIQGQETGKKIQLNDAIFSIEPNDHAIYLDVKQYLANNRQGTHKSKQRSEVTGSTRKLKKQKGTGTARAGSIKNPLFRGGGRVFGPTPRDYSFKLNKKVKQLARKSALSYKIKNNELLIVEDFHLDKPNTKRFIEIRDNLKISNKKTILVLTNQNKNIYLSSRNLMDAKVITVNELSTYDIMNASALMFVESSIAVLEKNFC